MENKIETTTIYCRVQGLGLRDEVGYCPHPVTVYIRGPIKGYIYINHIIITIQLLLRGGSTQPKTVIRSSHYYTAGGPP